MLCKHDGQCLGSQWPVDLAGGSSYRSSEAGLCRGLGSDWEHLPLTESQQASGVRKLEFLVFHGGPKDSPHVSQWPADTGAEVAGLGPLGSPMGGGHSF